MEECKKCGCEKLIYGKCKGEVGLFCFECRAFVEVVKIDESAKEIIRGIIGEPIRK